MRQGSMDFMGREGRGFHDAAISLHIAEAHFVGRTTYLSRRCLCAKAGLCMLFVRACLLLMPKLSEGKQTVSMQFSGAVCSLATQCCEAFASQLLTQGKHEP